MTVQSPPPTKYELIADTSAIIMSVDERARECNRKWGHNRLPHLVPIEWLERFRSQKKKFEAACWDCAGSPLPDDVALVRKHGEAMLRAFDRLEQLAVENGYAPVPPEHWEFELTDGTPVILVRNRSEISQINPQGRAVQVWSLEEVAQIIEKFPLIAATKEAFPGAEVIKMTTNKVVIDELNDSVADLPFA